MDTYVAQICVVLYLFESIIRPPPHLINFNSSQRGADRPCIFRNIKKIHDLRIAVNAAPRGGQQGGGQQPQRHKQFLEVKHVTRVNEPAMLAMDVHIDK